MENSLANAVTLFLVGGMVGSAILLKWGLGKAGIPALVGYLVLGFAVRCGDSQFPFIGEATQRHLSFLADLGVVVLLFQVGMESNLAGLIAQFRRAWLVWVGDVLVSGVVGFAASYYLLKFPLVPSLYIAVALTATSVAMSVIVWREVGVLNTENGEILLDVAELDDISAIFLMALLFAIVPVLQQHTGEMMPAVLKTVGILLVKLLLFGGFCFVFSQYVEHRLTRFVEQIKPAPDPMLMLACVGFVISALAGLLGFSVALGAFFAGLVYSRDPEAVKVERPFIVLYELFPPFFFIGIGMAIDPHVLTVAVVPGLLLLAGAVVGKFLGTQLPAVRAIGWGGWMLLGISMIPRAEIAMIVMRHGRQGGESVVPGDAFAAMVLVSAVTCMVSPIVLRPVLRRWKEQHHGDAAPAA